MSKRRATVNKWSIKPTWPERAGFSGSLGVPELIGQILYNRGISDLDQARRFLSPSLNDLIAPAGLSGMSEAVDRIGRAIAENEKIVLYGDYDVDGITGVAILWQVLRLAGREVDYYVPHRIDEGYGINSDAIERLAAKGTNLIITVDCGIGAHEQASLASDLGIDLIITDHHKVSGDLPRAVAILHPSLPGSDYPNRNLCGAGVAFKLAWGLGLEFSGSKKVSPEFREFLISATGLVALGTIADVVSLTGENRVLARFGLGGLYSSEDTGIRALISAAGLCGAKLDSSDIGFRLAPRLNAAGRMGHARLAVELFTKSTASRAAQIAGYLESQNKQRQKVEKEITAQAIDRIKSLGMDRPDCLGIVVDGEDWHAGVVGIVASRIVDTYRRPSIVLSRQSDRTVGSCRSIDGFDICAALESCSSHLTSFGGHAMAAGLTLPIDNIEAFRASFNAYAAERLGPDDLVNTLSIDAEVSLLDLDLETIGIIERLGPFGSGNPSVLLVSRGLRLAGPPRRVGSRSEHLQFTVGPADDASASSRPGGLIRAIGFGCADWEKKLLSAGSFDLAFEPSINRFNGSVTVQLIARDIVFH